MKHLFLAFLVIRFFIFTGDASAQSITDLIRNSGTSTTYPGSNVLIIYDSTIVDVRESGLSHYRFHQLVKILTPAGALEYRTVKLDYDPLSADVNFELVKVYRKNGRTDILDLTHVKDYPAPARAIYWGAREKMIGIGRLEPGDAVQIVYRKKGFTYALLTQESDDERFIPPMRGHFYDIVPFWNTHPVLEKVYIARLPEDKPLQFQFFNGECRPSLRFIDGKHIYTFVMKNIMPLKTEPGMVDMFDVAPKLILTTSPDWKAKSRWFYQVNEDYGSFNPTPETIEFVRELLKDARTEMDSVSILTHWVADNMRYSGISMGPGEGYTLHNTEMNFRDRCGVCKDKAALLISFLRIAGFEAYAAMTMAGSRIEDIPADHFNHSVAVVKLSDGQFHLLDPTWVPFIRELWSSAEQQQHYLIGLPEGADLMETPTSPSENHYLKIKANSSILSDGTLEGTMLIEAEGQTDAAVRNIFLRNYKSEWNKALEAELLRIHPATEILSADYGDPVDYLSGPIRIHLKYRIPRYAFVGRNELIFVPFLATDFLSRAMGHLSIDSRLEERKYPFRDRCSRMVDLDETITYPDGFQPVLPDVSNTSLGCNSFYNGYYKIVEGAIQLKQEVMLEKRVYEAHEWPQFRSVIINQKRMGEVPLVLRKKI